MRIGWPMGQVGPQACPSLARFCLFAGANNYDWIEPTGLLVGLGPSPLEKYCPKFVLSLLDQSRPSCQPLGKYRSVNVGRVSGVLEESTGLKSQPIYGPK